MSISDHSLDNKPLRERTIGATNDKKAQLLRPWSLEQKTKASHLRGCFAQSKRTKVQSSIKELECLVDQLRGQERVWGQRVRIASRDCGKAQLLSLTDAIVRTLPREIRDRIYEFYLSESGQKFSLHYLYAEIRWPSDQTELPLMLLPGYVEPGISQEVAEVAFKVGECYFHSHPRFSRSTLVAPTVLHLHDFLCNDFLGFGVVAQDHLRSLRLEIPKGTLRNADHLEKNLAALLHIRFKRGFHLQIFMLSSTKAEEVLKFLDTLRPIYLNLREEGARTEVYYTRLGTFERSTNVGLDTISDLPEEEWAAKVFNARTKAV